jgi:hypothetical protein
VPFEDELQRTWRVLVEKLPAAIRDGILDPKTSATDRLKYVEMALRLFNGPIVRSETELDIINARELPHVVSFTMYLIYCDATA